MVFAVFISLFREPASNKKSGVLAKSSSEVEQNLVIDNNEQERKNSEEQNHFADETIEVQEEKSEAVSLTHE